MALWAVFAGVYGMYLAIGPYDDAIFRSFFTQPDLLVKNLLPPVLILFFLWPLVRRAWLTWLIGGFVSMGFPAASYYLLTFRDEPMRIGMLRYLREGFAISSAAHYDLTPDGRLWGAIGVLAAGAAMLALVAKGRPGPRLLAWLPVAAALLLEPAYRAAEPYAVCGDETVIQRFSPTQQYLSKGFWYPFLHEALGPQQEDPDRQTRRLLEKYPDGPIPEDRKVDLLILQREAYADFSVYDIPGIDWRCYDLYHQIKEECYTGRLIANTFSGGTITTERAVLTGQWDAEEIDHPSDSYIWYLRDRGYKTVGHHPCYQWFYHRDEVNALLGFAEYFFSEDTFSALSGEVTAGDAILLPVIWEDYQSSDSPYCNFSVTYQGHGPYAGDYVRWENGHYADGALSGTSAIVMNNYLGSLADSDRQLSWLMDQLRESDRPAVLLVYGDHKPWLGDGASIYGELGIGLDLSTEEGFYHYFSTEYLMWANPAAQQVLGGPLTGQGPDISPCYLMDLLFEQLGWDGCGFARLMTEYRQVMPVVNVTGQYVVQGTLTQQLPEEWQGLAEEFFQVQSARKQADRGEDREK